MKKGLFITFEGGEGAGKTTQIKRVCAWLRSNNTPCWSTCEPGGTPLANRIRKILLDPKNKGLDPFLELTLYLAARRDHVDQVIRPRLTKGITILCDRFSDATVAYQGYGRKLPIPLIKKLNARATGGVRPDLTFLFDLPVQTGLHRTRGRTPGKEDRFENEAVPFHEKVRRGYLTLASKEKRRFRILDARKTPDELFGSICKEIRKRLT